MKFEIQKDTHYNCFNIFLDREVVGIWDEDIAQYLNLSLEEYQQILLKHNGKFRIDLYTGNIEKEFIDFITEKEAQDAVNVLEPYLILSSLMGE